MNVASLELCKELYKLSGWEDTSFQHECLADGSYITTLYAFGINASENNLYYPAYDLSYLLRRLPKYHKVEKTVYCLDLRPRMLLDGTHYHSWWCGLWYEHGGGARGLAVGEADTPEDAACKLAIELFQQGVI